MHKQPTRGRAVGEATAGRMVNVGVQDFEICDEADALPAQKSSARRARSANFVRLEQLRKLRECEQVAAVCYRVRGREIEFLLVQTGGGRWTFPKGSAEPGLTHAQAAALEAFEEAGVHGRMEQASFTRYMYAKRMRGASAAKLAVSAHLCEVTRLESPEESHRDPTWFSAAQARRSFRKDHASGAELARVVDCAVRRIRRLREEPLAGTIPSGCSIRKGQVRNAQIIAIDYLQRTANRRALPPG